MQLITSRCILLTGRRDTIDRPSIIGVCDSTSKVISLTRKRAMRKSRKSKETEKKSLLARAGPYFLMAAGILGGVFGLIQFGQWLGSSSLGLLSAGHKVELQKLQANLENQRDENAKLRSESVLLQKDIETAHSQLNKEQEKTRSLQSANQGLEKEASIMAPATWPRCAPRRAVTRHR